MALDVAKIAAYLQETQKAEAVLAQNQDLFDFGKLSEFQSATSALEENVKQAQQDSRKLSIGIVGAMKAGKSSFLNACIFHGKEYLPKAATPMTAALTKISYSETPRADIHFYTRKDWAKIQENSQKYDDALQTAYRAYDQAYQDKLQKMAREGGNVSSMRPELTLPEYERKLFRCNSEVLKSAKELTRMASDPALEARLGGVDTLTGDIMSQLNDYVGAHGCFTPIVNYVELQVDLPELKDLEIVDTPGLNDPVVSRGFATRQFLRACDVVVLLSPCSQFMDANTIELMANVLPENGVERIIVVGSKLDSGILNEPPGSYSTACQTALQSYHSQFQRSMGQVKRTCTRRANILEKIGEGDLLFVSSICFSIANKLKQGIALNEEERLVFKNLHLNYPDFEDAAFSDIGGIADVHEVLKGVQEQKASIFDARNASLLETTRLGHLRVLEKIQQELSSSLTTLKTSTSEDLQQRGENIRTVIGSSRSKLMYIFQGAAIGCKNKVNQLLPQITLEMQNHQDIDVETKSHEETDTVRSGLFGWRREVIRYTVTDNRADTSAVVQNIQQYASSCQNRVNQEFQHIFNKESLSRQIVEVVLEAFRKSGTAFDEADILLPLQNVLNELSSPEIKFDYTPYIDKVESQFPSGYAENEDIHKLKALQVRLLDEIDREFGKQLTAALEKASNILNGQAVTFADRIENLFCGELEKLQGQIKERETYIDAYQKFAGTIKQIKVQLANAG